MFSFGGWGKIQQFLKLGHGVDLASPIENVHAFLHRDDRIAIEVGSALFELRKIFHRLQRALRTEQDIFFGKGRCAGCHQAPYYTDNLMHNLQAERFYTPRMVNGMMASADGPIKTFPLRGVKDSPPYLHDGRLLTLEDTVEFFNLMLETQLSAQEKADLVAFLRAL
jgi:hypothetical protein